MSIFATATPTLSVAAALSPPPLLRCQPPAPSQLLRPRWWPPPTGSFLRPSIYLLPTATFNDAERALMGPWKTYLKVLHRTAHPSRLRLLMRNRPSPKSYKFVGLNVDLSGLCAFVMPVEPRSQNILCCVCKSPEGLLGPMEGYEAACV